VCVFVGVCVCVCVCVLMGGWMGVARIIHSFDFGWYAISWVRKSVLLVAVVAETKSLFRTWK
jgi:hypothetical protein